MRFRHGDNRVGQRHPLYKTWAGIMRRCYNKNEKNFERYGGRGIGICLLWRDYANFKADMGPSWVPGLSIERIDNNGDYSPENCRWATAKEQARNRRSSFFITFRGETRTAIEWGEVLGVPWTRFYQRIVKLGWPVDQAMTEPAHPTRGRTKAA